MKTIQLIFLVMVIIGVSKTQISAQNEKVKDGIYFSCEEMPEYPGGLDSLRSELARSIKYPEDAAKKGIQGKVYVSFVIDEAGKVTDVTLARGVDPLLDKEALRVVKGLKDWTPGKEKGNKVKVAFTLPIQFALDEKKEKK